MKKTLVLIIMIVWIGFSVYVWTSPQNDASLEERRKLKQFPNLTVDSLLQGQFTDQFEPYVQDQFPHRFEMRQIKANFRYYGLGVFENNGYFKDHHKIMKIEYPLKESEIIKAGQLFTDVKETYFPDNNNVYVSIIPDKAYYTSNSTVMTLDYSRMENLLLNSSDGLKYIDIKNDLNRNHFYNTDIHWKQEEIEDVSKSILKAMNKQISDYQIEETQEAFTGVYYGHSALKTPKDQIQYINNEAIEKASVNLLDQSNLSVYNIEALKSRDQYDFYLYGPQALVEIVNEDAASDDEIIIFRDSFGSSIAPYFIGSYRKITLVDLRYISSSLLNEYLEFNDQDILFLYSGTVLNSSSMLKR